VVLIRKKIYKKEIIIENFSNILSQFSEYLKHRKITSESKKPYRLKKQIIRDLAPETILVEKLSLSEEPISELLSLEKQKKKTDLLLYLKIFQVKEIYIHIMPTKMYVV